MPSSKNVITTAKGGAVLKNTRTKQRAVSPAVAICADPERTATKKVRKQSVQHIQA